MSTALPKVPFPPKPGQLMAWDGTKYEPTANVKAALTFSATLTFADAVDIAFDTATGTKIGTSPTQKIGFYNATPIAQPASTTDLRTALINLGLYATGGASPLNLNGGAFTAASITASTSVTLGDAVNVAVNTATGSKIGTATTQKLGFWNAAPIVQPSGATQAAPAAYVTGAFGLDSSANMQALYDLVVALRLALVNAGIIKGGV